ncbi:hypothetical protein RRG08_046977 [Elysia crispata]|uniref:Uncharacterized protein n=1 Tax=Elysia crispata TaxID=231223 RepID=A0AAE1A8Y3_9GAST|nr:hypothetical protein RRG08_046977 [Elysia crispata]
MCKWRLRVFIAGRSSSPRPNALPLSNRTLTSFTALCFCFPLVPGDLYQGLPSCAVTENIFRQKTRIIKSDHDLRKGFIRVGITEDHIAEIKAVLGDLRVLVAHFVSFCGTNSWSREACALIIRGGYFTGSSSDKESQTRNDIDVKNSTND